MKNPFMSAWLSAANQMTGAARGHASAEMSRLQTDLVRQQAEMMEEWSRMWMRLWFPWLGDK